MNQIASYNLFGEHADLPDVVHCETIAARSVKQVWELTPHRHAHLHQVLMMSEGGGRGTFDAKASGSARAASPMFPPAACTPTASPPAPKAGW